MRVSQLVPTLVILAGCEITIAPLPQPADSGSTSAPTTTVTSDQTSEDITSSVVSSTPTPSSVSSETPLDTSSGGSSSSGVTLSDAGVDSDASMSDGTSGDSTPDTITSESPGGLSSEATSSSDSQTSGPPNTETPTLPGAPVVPPAVVLGPGCGISPKRCPQSGVLGEETCNMFGSDWWPYKAADEAGPHHTPLGTGLVGFRAEHITPYGGWFSFVQPWSSIYEDDFMVCWSTSSSALDTLAGLDAALADGRCQSQRSLTREGLRVKPIIVTTMNPGTTYFVRAVYMPTWPVNHAENPASDVVMFTTLPDPKADLALGGHPRLAVTQDQLAALQARYEANDPRVLYWLSMDEGTLPSAYSPTSSVYLPHQFGIAAALRWRLTGETTHRDGALALLGRLLDNYQSTILTGNQYRWEGSDLAVVTDLLWDELSVAEREEILSAMLTADEYASNRFPDFSDTDQQVSFAWIQISHALLFLDDTEIDAGLRSRAEAVFDHAVRRWYGLQQPKMRRANKIYGVAGGEMDDGVDYAQGTQRYWLETIRFLDNNGMSQADYSEWIWNHFQTHSIYGLVPDKSGLTTWGDVENNGLLANGTQELHKQNWSSSSLHICLLRDFCRNDEAGYVRDTLLKVWEPLSNWGPHHWALLCDDTSVTPKSYTDLPLMYHSEGLGNVYARSSWDENASYLFFSAGWRGVDHNHDDVGHFSFWVNGEYIVHEIPEYEETSASHSVLLLGERDTQNLLWKKGSDSKIVSTSTSNQHLFVLADTTSAYNWDNSHPGWGEERIVFDQITRSLYWDKLTDRVIVYDRIVGGPPTAQPNQNFVGSAVVNQLYNESSDGTIELLSVVNGSGNLVVTDGSIGVEDLVLFDRASGQLQ